MLRIRKEQVEAFQPVAEAEFSLRIMEHLRQHHAQTVVRLPQGATLVNRMSESTLVELIHSGIARARTYGLIWSSSISAFVVLMFKAAPNFDEHPAIHQFLIDEAVPPQDRVQSVLDKTSASVWSETRERYDAAAWQPKPTGAQG
jgi:hypothetical protein